jgi:hypothetical protein
MAISELLASDRARVLSDGAGPLSNDPFDAPGVILANLSESERRGVLERAAHLREVLTGYRLGSAETAIVGEPRAQFDPRVALMRRYEAKAAELGVGLRTLRRWVNDFRQTGEAGLVESAPSASPTGRRVNGEVHAEFSDPAVAWMPGAVGVGTSQEGSSESIVCFQRFSQFRRGPTTKDSSSLTGPWGSSAASATAAQICSLKATVDADAVVFATSTSVDGGGNSRAASIRTDDRSLCCFVHHTDTRPGCFKR